MTGHPALLVLTQWDWLPCVGSDTPAVELWERVFKNVLKQFRSARFLLRITADFISYHVVL